MRIVLTLAGGGLARSQDAVGGEMRGRRQAAPDIVCGSYPNRSRMLDHELVGLDQQAEGVPVEGGRSIR